MNALFKSRILINPLYIESHIEENSVFSLYVSMLTYLQILK